MKRRTFLILFLLLNCKFGLINGSNYNNKLFLIDTKTDTIFKAGSLYNNAPSYGNIYGATPDNDNIGRIGNYSMQSSVNECGASEIMIPLELNEGINGMTPKLSLCYNSQAGNGIMGLGWSLGGMSKISRVPYSYLYNDSCSSVLFSDTDMLSLDGNTLIKGSKDGVTCYYPEIYDYSIVYPITNGYKVLKNNGIVNTYTSKYMLQGINAPIEWHLTRSEDPLGNYIEYFYTNDATNGAMYPTSIKYTGTNSVLPKYEIRFDYDTDTRIDCPPKWFSQSRTAASFSRVTRKLRSIQLYREGAKILEYFLTYTSTTLDWNIRALCEVKKSYYEVANSDSNLDPAYNMVSPLKFEWEKADYALNYESVASVGIEETYNEYNHWAQSTAFAARFSHTSWAGFNNYVQDVVLLMQNHVNLKYKMHVLTNNNVVGQTGQGYNFQMTQSGVCQNINDSFSDGRSIDAFIPADTDGDGLNEIVCVSRLSSISKLAIIKPTSNGDFNETVIQSNLGTYQYSNFCVGDFNGDGLSDLMCIKDNTTLMIWMSTASGPFSVCINKAQITTSSSPSSIRVCVGDFCGDKRDRILIISNESDNTKQAKLYQVRASSNTFTIPAALNVEGSLAQNFFTSGTHRLCQGDFNGDSKQDIVLMRNQQWNFYFSKGNGVFSDALMYSNSNITSDAFVITNENNTNNFSFVTDLDQDGCDDIAILKIDNLYNNTYKGIRRRDFLIRPTNTSVIVLKRANLTSGGADICIDSIKNTQTTFGSNSPLIPIIGNFKGLLPNEIMTCRLVDPIYNSTNYFSTRFRNSGTLENPPMRAISKIISNFGAITKFEYCPMSYQAPANQRIEETPVQRDLTAVLPYYGYLNIVKRMETETLETSSDKIFRATRYYYSFPRYHTRGRGFLGFLSTWNRKQGQFTNEDIQTFNIYTVNTNHHVLIPVSTEKKHFGPTSAHTLLTHTKTNYTYIFKTKNNNGFHSQLGQIPNGVFHPFLSASVTNNFDDSPTGCVKESFGIDRYGNTNDHIIQYGQNEASLNLYERTFYYFDNNITAQRWITGMPTSKTTRQKLYGGQPDVERKETYTNDTNTGLCTSKTEGPNNAKALTENYTYDSRGNMVGKTSTNMDMTLTETMTYDAYGNVQSSTNALSQTTTYQYDYAGRLISQTDPNGLVTEYEYNVLGDLVGTNHPDGLVEQRELRWVEHNTSSPTYHPDTPGSGYPYPIYFEWRKKSTGEESYTFYDQFSRKIRDVSYSIDNRTIYVDYLYNDKNKLLKYVSNPYFHNDTARWTHFEYDYLGRLVKTTRPNGSISTQSYNGSTSTKRDFDGQTTTLTYNSAGLVTKSTNGVDNPTAVDFTYYGDGLVKASKVDNNNATTISYHYDIHRHPDSIVDPSLGTRLYNYDAWGNLRRQTTPKGVTQYEYDLLFRPTRRTEPDGVSQWTYDTGVLGTVSSTVYTPTTRPTVSEQFVYDNYGHPIKHSQAIANDTISFSYTYDNHGRQTSITYPHNIKFYYFYATNGMLQKIGYTTSSIYWNALSTNAFGKTSLFKVGNFIVNHYYNSKSGLMTGIDVKRNIVKKFSQAYQWSPEGNLTMRTDTIFNLKETFSYDSFNRLVSMSTTNITPQNLSLFESQTYDAKGNIEHRGTSTRYYYDNNIPYAVSNITPTANSGWMYTQQLQYTSFDKLREVSQSSDKISLDYGIDRQRVLQTETTGNDTTRVKRYFTQLYEEVKTQDGHKTSLMYIIAPTGLCCVAERPLNYSASNSIYLTLLDYQGSLSMVVKSTASSYEYLSYDAWGCRRDPSRLTYDNVQHRYDRGYTMHEHYDKFGLINMNGRLYAPAIARMLSPDIVIQDQYNSQAYNSYSYCLNNPLRYTDPSGYVVTVPPGFENYYFPNLLHDPDAYVLELANHGVRNAVFNTEATEGKTVTTYSWIIGNDTYKMVVVDHMLKDYQQMCEKSCVASAIAAQERRMPNGNKELTEEYIMSQVENSCKNGLYCDKELAKATVKSNVYNDYTYFNKNWNLKIWEEYSFKEMADNNAVLFRFYNDILEINPTFSHTMNASYGIQFLINNNVESHDIMLWDSDFNGVNVGGYKPFIDYVNKYYFKIGLLKP